MKARIVIIYFIFTAFAIAFTPLASEAYAAQSAAGGETALTIDVMSSSEVSAEKILLSDIAVISLSEGFECDVEKVGAIEIGHSPRPGSVRVVRAFEIAGACARRMNISEGSLKMSGALSCAVTRARSCDTSAYKASLLKEIGGKAKSLFIEKFSGKYQIDSEDRLNFKIVSGLSETALKRISGIEEIKLAVLSYRSGTAGISVSGPEGPVATLYARVTYRHTACRAGARIARGERLDFSRLEGYEIEIFPEKRADYISPFQAPAGGLASCELPGRTSVPAAGGEGGHATGRDASRTAGSALFASRDIAAGEIVKSVLFNKKSDVRAGQMILLSVAGARSTLSFNAVARSSGSTGETVEAVNPKTQRRYKARVTGPGEAEAI